MTDTRNIRLEAALAYAKRGWFVFPCAAGTKIPATARGWQDASQDVATIESWWRENPHYNVAVATGLSNLLVLDVDPEGLDHWPAFARSLPDLERLHDKTLTVRTPRGGFHMYMAGTGPSSASRLAPGIDTRGAGGYVVAPPSRVTGGKAEGHYVGAIDAPVMPAPSSFLEALARAKPPREATGQREPLDPAEWDSIETVRRAERWLESLVAAGDVAVEGCGGDSRTFEVACALMERGITPETALDLLLRLWNPACVPPWSPDDLARKVRNAWEYGEDTRGGKADPPIDREHGHLLAAHGAGGDDDNDDDDDFARFRPRRLADIRRTLKPVEWIVENILPAKGTGIVYGPSGTFKSFVLLDLALSVATGFGPNWWRENPRPARPVLYLAGEGAHAFCGDRSTAWAAQNPVPGILEDARMYVAENVPPFEVHDYWARLVATMRTLDAPPALVVIDTLSCAMIGLDENSSRDAGRATSKMQWLSRELDAFVLAVHHTGKTIERGMRGSYAWHANVDTVIETARQSKDHFEVDIWLQKQKDGEPMREPIHLDGVLHGKTPAFVRDWNYTAPAERDAPRAPSGPGSEEWLQVETLAARLAAGPMHVDHMAESLAQEYGVQKRRVLRALRSALAGRLRAWAPDGDIMRLPTAPAGHISASEF